MEQWSLHIPRILQLVVCLVGLLPALPPGQILQKFCDAETEGTTESISTSSFPVSSGPNFDLIAKRIFFNPP